MIREIDQPGWWARRISKEKGEELLGPYGDREVAIVRGREEFKGTSFEVLRSVPRFRVTERKVVPAPAPGPLAWKDKPKATTDGEPPEPGLEYGPAPKPIDPKTGQHGAYYVLPGEERVKGFVRAFRRTYVHDKCKQSTTMAVEIAETYAVDPGYYSATFCCACQAHFPVEEFTWAGTDQRVGS